MQDRCLFSRIGMLSESTTKIMSKGKVMTRNSILGYYPYTLFQTLPRGLEARGTKGPLRKAENEKGISQLFTRRSLHSPLSVLRQTPSETPSNKKENPQAFLLKGSLFENGGYLLSHFYAVPSAWLGLTSLFGMGRGGTPTL